MLRSCVFSPFSIALERRAGLCAFRVFGCFAGLWFVSLSSFSWCQGLAATCDCGRHSLDPSFDLLIFFFFFFFFFL